MKDQLCGQFNKAGHRHRYKAKKSTVSGASEPDRLDVPDGALLDF